MPWVTERYCHGLIPDWGIWDYGDKLLQSFEHDNILLYPLAHEDETIVTEFLESDSRNHVVFYNFVDPTRSYDCTDRIHVLPVNEVFFFEYWLSHKVTDFGVTEPNYVNDFLCYQRKPSNARPQVYDALKDRNGIVTIGTKEFNFNSGIPCSPDISDGDYHPQSTNPNPPIVRNDADTLGNIDVWNDSFLIMVSETVRYPQGDFFSEKTFKPMMGKRPFITLGANEEYYQDLRNIGYHTFEQDFPKFTAHNKDVVDQAVELADFLSTMDQRSYYMDNKQKFDDNYENLKSAIDRNTQSLRNYLSQLIA